MKLRTISPWILPLFIYGLTGCDLKQEVDIDLPAYESRLVVECYLEPGKPITLLLSRSAAYFDAFPTFDQRFLEEVLVSGADISITHRERTYPLSNELTFDHETRKVFNYRSNKIIPADYESAFYLNILTPEGDRISANTRLLPAIPIDSLVVDFSEDDPTKARILTYLTDPPEQENFYRRILHEGSLDNDPEQDFPANDRIVEDVLLFGTAFDYKAGDTLVSTIYHIEEAYFNFLESVQTARNSNGNPFAQPSPIISNLEGNSGAIGIFTGLSYDRKTIVLE
jgi:hypothetical protein